MRTRRTFRPIEVAALVAVTLLSSAGVPVSGAASSAPESAPRKPAAKARPGSPAARPAPPRVRHTLPFISDDYGRALAEAKARQVPIFVESWAPW